MANPSPDTSGLKPFNTMSDSERTAIQSAGGTASAKKRRELKTMREIIQDLRQAANEDPLIDSLKVLLNQSLYFTSNPKDVIKTIALIHKILGEDRKDKQE